VVMAGRIQIVQSDGVGKPLDGEPVTAGRLVDDSEQIQADLVRRGARQNLSANNFGLLGAPLLISPFCVGRQIGDVGWRGSGNGLTTRNGGPTLSSVHTSLRPIKLNSRVTLIEHLGSQQEL